MRPPLNRLRRGRGTFLPLTANRMRRIGGWVYNSICNRSGRLPAAAAVNETIIFTAVLASVPVKYSPWHRRWQVSGHG